MFGYFLGFTEGVRHPYIGYGDHQRKPDWAGVLGGVALAVEEELGRGEAEAEKLADVVDGEFSTVLEGSVIGEKVKDDFDAFFDRNGRKKRSSVEGGKNVIGVQSHVFEKLGDFSRIFYVVGAGRGDRSDYSDKFFC